jgi:hypothetical protein
MADDILTKGNLGRFVQLRPNPIRKLKSKAAQRKVPLHPVLEHLLDTRLPKTGRLFPGISVDRVVKRYAFLRRQPADGPRLGGAVLQPARHRRAAHQGRQTRLPLDATVMPEVPRQRGAAATARAGLQPGNLPALHRTVRGHGGLVIDQPATQADQDRGACRAPRPRDHFPAGRGGRHRPDGSRHPRRHPPIASPTTMRMTAIQAQAERKWQDKSVRCAEKHRRRARPRWLRLLIHPVPAPRPAAEAAQGGKCLSSASIQAIFTSAATPLGECRFNARLCRRQSFPIIRKD